MYSPDTSSLPGSNGIANWLQVFYRSSYLNDEELCAIYSVYAVFQYPLPGSDGEFTVKTREKEFLISHYPLEHSKFLYDMYQGKKKFGGEINKYFDYTLFSYRLGLSNTFGLS